MRISFEVKKRHIALIIVLALIYAIAYWWIWLDPWNHGYKKSAAAARAVEWAMGKPDNKGNPPPKLTKQLAILHLDMDEWNKISCREKIYLYKENCFYNKALKVNQCISIPSDEQVLTDVTLKECLNILTGLPSKRKLTLWPFDNISDYAAKYCGVFHRSNCIVLKVHEYALQHPEILKTIIYAAEHPCKFIPSKQQYCASINDANKCKYYDSVWDEAKKLSCNISNKKSLEKIIIIFNDENNHEKFHLISERKD
jgi:hypothetical protein